MKAKRDRFPIVIKRGSSVVKIYRDRKPTGTYYRVAYHFGGKRHRLHFNDLEKATSEAGSESRATSRGDMDAMQLVRQGSPEFTVAHWRRLENMACRWTLPRLSTARRASFWTVLRLVDAARFYARHHGNGIKRKPVAEAVEEMIEAKKLGGVSDVYLNDLRYRLGVCLQTLQCDLVSLTPDDIQSFFDSITLSPAALTTFSAC